MTRRPIAYHSRSLDLPPAFRLTTLREVGDAFAHACANATELGAGALVTVGRFDIAEFAVVLEPDEPLVSARHVMYAGMLALADALAALAPPQKAIKIGWPDAIRFDGRLIGGGRIAWPSDATEAAPPEWLVFGAMIRMAALTGDGSDRPAPGDPWVANPERLAEGFARHIMRSLDRWRDAGFESIAGDYISRLEADAQQNANLMRPEALPVVPTWLAPETGEPCG